jgi:DNA uptake protein ComE-like DNA-binding protein
VSNAGTKAAKVVGRLPSEVQAHSIAGQTPSKPTTVRRPNEALPSQYLPPDVQAPAVQQRIVELGKQGLFTKAAEAMATQAGNEEFVEEVLALLATAASVEGQSVKTIGLNQNSLHALQTVVRRSVFALGVWLAVRVRFTSSVATDSQRMPL